MRMPALTGLRRHAMCLVLGLALGIASLSGTPSAQTWSGTASPDDLRYRLDILDAELADIRARLGGSVASVAPSVSGGGNVAVETELRRLTSQIEQLQNQVNRIQQDATRRFGDIEFRLTELEGGDGAAVGLPTPVGGQPVTTSPQAGGQQVAALSVSEQGDFDRAVNDVQQGRFDQAESRLVTFLQRYPSSPLIPDAYFWLGESKLVRGAHADAAKAYLDGYRSSPRGTRAPDNLYKLGLSLGRLGQIAEACETLRQVRVQFPNAPDGLVGRADAEADTLNCG